MKANPISSGLVNLLLCLHCGAFSRFASFGIASAPKGFLARVVMETQHVEITEPVAWWENVTALACLYKIRLAVLIFFLSAFPVFCSIVSFSSFGFSTSVFPDTTRLFGFPLFSLIFCVGDYGVVFVCFFFCFNSVPELSFRFKMFVFLWLNLFVRFVFLFFKMMLLCFLTLGVQMQMPNEIISVYTASVPVILFIAIHYWKN